MYKIIISNFCIYIQLPGGWTLSDELVNSLISEFVRHLSSDFGRLLCRRYTLPYGKVCGVAVCSPSREGYWWKTTKKSDTVDIAREGSNQHIGGRSLCPLDPGQEEARASWWIRTHRGVKHRTGSRSDSQ